MNAERDRRSFLKASAATTAAALVSSPLEHTATAAATSSGETQVVVWDERQPAQKQVYENFLGNEIAAHLRTILGLKVRSVGIDDPGQGLSADILEDCQVLIWWGHGRHAEVTPETGRKIVERILAGATSLIAIHSAHWSTPFMEAMHERARRDLARTFGSARVEIREVVPSKRYTFPKYDARLTPYSNVRKYPDGSVKAELYLPYCCFPAYRHDGKPSTVRVLKPDHPIAQGLPSKFEISQTEMYDEPFHVPEPDEVILEECWSGGEWFRSGSVWRLGKGRVFYFRPGHETYPVFKEKYPLHVIANAARWLGGKSS